MADENLTDDREVDEETTERADEGTRVVIP